MKIKTRSVFVLFCSFFMLSCNSQPNKTNEEKIESFKIKLINDSVAEYTDYYKNGQIKELSHYNDDKELHENIKNGMRQV